MNQRTQILSLIAVLLVTFAMVSITKNTKAKERIYSSTILGCNIPSEARCTGSANCRACKNCKYCKHCSRGGSCGVCAKRNRTKSYTNPYKSYKKPKQTKQTIFDGRKTNSTLSLEEPYYLKTLLVNKNSLNLRSGPDTSYYVIQQLDFGEKLTILATHAKWIKVKVQRTKVIGFVHASGVLLVEK
ncbi:SH3 domain-containing protein [Tenacibaculum sp. 1B UA]|uniref:SH3 domain-containing protein n=1 Tax=Tenacibaculum sp. 1B UA TaxID=2922252 RepID=UPI002A23E936|nr:SH3 domain-containing protein [Tenacibaculum sp. 1B UA]MDX8554201.1 SH3 domain-containing protein [Tenacibaculum sp. 1B UA]